MNIFMYDAYDSDAQFAMESTNEIISIKLKPYALEFLNDMKSKYELVVYSSMNIKYIKPIIEYLEQNGKYFDYYFCEEYCIFANVYNGIKCLDFLYETRSANDVVVVDTSIKNYPLNFDSFVPGNVIERNDNELPKLAKILDRIYDEKDIRFIIRKCMTNSD